VPPVPIQHMPGGFPSETPDIPTPIPEGDENQTPEADSGGGFWNPKLQNLNDAAQNISPSGSKNGITPSASTSSMPVSPTNMTGVPISAGSPVSTDFGAGKAVSENNGSRVGRAQSRKLKSRGGQSYKTTSWGKEDSESQGVLYLQTLLRGIDTSTNRGGQTGSGNTGVVLGGRGATSGRSETLTGVGKSKVAGAPPY